MEHKIIHKVLCLQITKTVAILPRFLGDIATSHMEEGYERY